MPMLLLALISLGSMLAPNELVIDRTHSGVVVTVAAGKLTMSDGDGKNEHVHQVTEIAKVTLDGMPAMLATLRAGDQVTVTMDPEGQVIGVAARRGAGVK